MNRLKLDFTLETAQERIQFINSYIVQFPDLTNKEATTIANYLLWGKNEEGVPIGADLNLETKWTKEENIPDSLESVLESPSAAHIYVKGLNEATIYKKPRVVFDREEARKTAPACLLETYENLWRQIDELDLEICFYEERIGKRSKPPRNELLKRFSSEEIELIRARSQKLNQYGYLKKRHQLIDLRREQFTIRDSYQTNFTPAQTIHVSLSHSTVFDSDVEVRPLGLCDTKVGHLIFDKNFDPAALNEEQLSQISKLIWEKKTNSELPIFDFTDLEAVYQLYLFKFDIIDQAEKDLAGSKIESNQLSLINTLNFYEEMADLTDLQLEILRMKEKKYKNTDIAGHINEKYGKSYTANYISTIFRQKIIVKVNEAAKLHRDTIENCFFPENFRKCTSCGRVLLLDSRNWVRKARSKDGFQNKCKRCEKKARKKKQERELIWKKKLQRKQKKLLK